MKRFLAVLPKAQNVPPHLPRKELNFPRLRHLISSEFNEAKDRLWALREDPSYFADTVHA